MNPKRHKRISNCGMLALSEVEGRISESLSLQGRGRGEGAFPQLPGPGSLFRILFPALHPATAPSRSRLRFSYPGTGEHGTRNPGASGLAPGFYLPGFLVPEFQVPSPSRHPATAPSRSRLRFSYPGTGEHGTRNPGASGLAPGFYLPGFLVPEFQVPSPSRHPATAPSRSRLGKSPRLRTLCCRLPSSSLSPSFFVVNLFPQVKKGIVR